MNKTSDFSFKNIKANFSIFLIVLAFILCGLSKYHDLTDIPAATLTFLITQDNISYGSNVSECIISKLSISTSPITYSRYHKVKIACLNHS